jgi:transcription-repair coupling factor (superfamily II helicase)
VFGSSPDVEDGTHPRAAHGGGYERVAQVTTRGQFAVRGGIIGLYSWRRRYCTLEFLATGIESLREFDIDIRLWCVI